MSSLEKIRPYNIFLAESAIDAMSFYELFKHKYDLNNSLLVSSGGGLSNFQIENIIKQYPSAKLYGIFDNDISGILYSIRVAAIKESQSIRINKENEFISFELEKKDKSFKIPIDNLSFTEFKNQSGLRPRFTVIKPKNFKDFNQMLKAQKNEAVNLKR